MASPAEAGLQIAESGIEPLKLRQTLRLAAAHNRPVRDVGVRSRSATCPSRLGHRRLFRVGKRPGGWWWRWSTLNGRRGCGHEGTKTSRKRSPASKGNPMVPGGSLTRRHVPVGRAPSPPSRPGRTLVTIDQSRLMRTPYRGRGVMGDIAQSDIFLTDSGLITMIISISNRI